MLLSDLEDTADHVEQDLKAKSIHGDVELANGQRYRCIGGHTWQHTSKATTEASAPGCRLDAMMAVAHAQNLSMDRWASLLPSSLRGTNKAPTLYKEGEPNTLYRFAKVGDHADIDYPMSIPADLKFASSDTQGHRLHSHDAISKSLRILELHRETSPPSAPPSPPSSSAPSSAPSPPSSSAPPSAPSPSPPSSSAPSSAPSSAEFECAFPRKPSGTACSTDAQCPLTATQARDAMLATVDSSKKHSLRDLNASFKFSIDEGIDILSAGADLDAKLTPAQTRKVLLRTLETNPGMLSSTSRALHANGLAPPGLCGANGACTTTKERSRTNHPLYTGKNTVTLRATEEYVTYTRDTDAPRLAHARKCDARKDDECDAATAVDGDTLRAPLPLAPAYRVSLEDGEYLFTNKVMGRSQEECARKLCAHYKDSCPYPVCAATKSGQCVPPPSE